MCPSAQKRRPKARQHRRVRNFTPRTHVDPSLRSFSVPEPATAASSRQPASAPMLPAPGPIARRTRRSTAHESTDVLLYKLLAPEQGQAAMPGQAPSFVKSSRPEQGQAAMRNDVLFCVFFCAWAIASGHERGARRARDHNNMRGLHPLPQLTEHTTANI